MKKLIKGKNPYLLPKNKKTDITIGFSFDYY